MMSLSFLCLLQLPLDTLVFMLNRFTADDFSKEGIPAGEKAPSHSSMCAECSLVLGTVMV